MGGRIKGCQWFDLLIQPKRLSKNNFSSCNTIGFGHQLYAPKRKVRFQVMNRHIFFCSRLFDIRFVSYYGFMLNRLYELRSDSSYCGIMERTLTRLGLRPRNWRYASQCCGAFLTVARPNIVAPEVNTIM